MAYQEFDPALTLPVNFTVRDNPFENSKQKYPKQMRLFIPLTSIDEFCKFDQIATLVTLFVCG